MSLDAGPERRQVALLTVLAALADPVRLAVVRALAVLGEANCTELRGASQIRCGKSTLSHHMRVLRQAGLTRTRVVGAQHRVSLRKADLDALFPGLLDAVVDPDILAARSANTPVHAN